MNGSSLLAEDIYHIGWTGLYSFEGFLGARMSTEGQSEAPPSAHFWRFRARELMVVPSLEEDIIIVVLNLLVAIEVGELSCGSVVLPGR